MIYGDHDLQRGDHDGSTTSSKPPRWGNVEDPPSARGLAQTPTQGGSSLAVPGHVEQLQRDLRELGFLIVGSPDGGFGKLSEWAVREFQIYASMENVARLDNARLQELTGNQQAGEAAHEVAALGAVPSIEPPKSYYVATLRQTANTARYTGPISGVVNARTRAALEHWLDNNYRCPVVVEAWSMKGGVRAVLFDGGCNVWGHNSITSANPRFFTVDFSDYYELPSNRAGGDYQALGTFTPQGFRGPRSEPRYGHCWPEAEMTPERLIGETATIASLQSSLQGPAASTYRIIRAVSEQECFGYFDSINSWDNALVSLGPCHWTLGIFNNDTARYGDGELSSLLSYAHQMYHDDYMAAFGNFGLLPAATWGDSGSTQLISAQAKFASWVRTHSDTVHGPDAASAEVPPNTSDSVRNIPLVDRTRDEADYYKSWHWFYRWAMATRTVVGIQRSMWDMARIRIRMMQQARVDVATKNRRGETVNISLSLGEIITSEKGVGIAHRWHVYRPGHVIGVRPSTPHLRNAIKSAVSNSSLDWTQPPQAWTDEHESELIESILAAANSQNGTHQEVADWPGDIKRRPGFWTLRDELGKLSSQRNSFQLDTRGI